ncbi:unnamed protein product [Amaranthus hypochondriacus]
MGHTEGRCRSSELRKKVGKTAPRKEGESRANGGTVDTTPTKTQVQEEPIPSIQLGQVEFVQALDPPKSPLALPTQGITIEIYSTNASGEMIITTVEVNIDPRLKGNPSHTND